MGTELEMLNPRSGRRLAEVAFEAHAAVWALVNLFLVLIWAVTGAGPFWPVWTILPWGFALGIQAWITWGLFGR
ncbi:MAG TPA: 2TM domain-containing protein [Acidimicrobiales bacterium]|nr:2TM domain-containing protein [Acidimicrobiales bacterium]